MSFSSFFRRKFSAFSAMTYFAKESYRVDRYNCAFVDLNNFTKHYPKIEENLQQFESLLNNTNKKWKEENVRGSWFYVPIAHSVFVPTLVKNGYVYHHAKPDCLVLLKWLSDEENNVPHYAYTNIGVGGIVMDDENRVLVIKEKHNFGIDYWKFPGGCSDPGEEFAETAVREIYEETGIKATFQSLVLLRHSHKFQFDCSDIYVLCYMKPVKDDTNPNLEPKPCAREVTAVSWIPATELIDQLSAFNRFALQKVLESREKNVAITLEKIDSVLKHLGKQSIYSIDFNLKI